MPKYERSSRTIRSKWLLMQADDSRLDSLLWFSMLRGVGNLAEQGCLALAGINSTISCKVCVANRAVSCGRARRLPLTDALWVLGIEDLGVRFEARSWTSDR
jgi:hypothetical protein